MVVGDFVGIFNVSLDVIRFFGRDKDRIRLFPQLLAIRMRDKSRALSRTVISHRNTVL